MRVIALPDAANDEPEPHVEPLSGLVRLPDLEQQTPDTGTRRFRQERRQERRGNPSAAMRRQDREIVDVQFIDDIPIRDETDDASFVLCEQKVRALPVL